MNYAKEYQLTTSMRHYLLPAMIEQFGDLCAECGEQRSDYQIDHLRYGDDVTMYDLQLLCVDCHKAKTLNSSEAWLVGSTHCATCTCWQ